MAVTLLLGSFPEPSEHAAGMHQWASARKETHVMRKKRKSTDSPPEASASSSPYEFTGLRGRNLREIERTLRAARRARRRAYAELCAQRREFVAASVPTELANELARQHWLSEFTPWTHSAHEDFTGRRHSQRAKGESS